MTTRNTWCLQWDMSSVLFTIHGGTDYYRKNLCSRFRFQVRSQRTCNDANIRFTMPVCLSVSPHERPENPEILGPYGDAHEDRRLLGRSTAQSGRNLPTF
jgi:hypothetical protein